MSYIDQTPTFRTLISSSSASGPSSPRKSSRPTSRARSKQALEAQAAEAEFLKEAYRIHNHLSSLSTHLTSIRRPYLSLTDPPLSRRRQQRPPNPNDNGTAQKDDGDELGGAYWDGAKYLSDRDREEIDLRAKAILRRCRERIGILEDGEKARQKKVAPPPSTLFSFLPSLAPSPASHTDAVLTAHRAAVLLTLSTLLARTTQTLGNLQEERSKRRAERGRTLGEGAEREARGMILPVPRGITSMLNGNQGERNEDPQIVQVQGNTDPTLSSLSPDQIQTFEQENSALLTHLSSTLTSVLRAESSLAEISQLQTQLVQHLASQTEMVDLLYDQAVGSVGEMKGAGEQLKRAKERGGEARLFLLVFLVGASLALLFLDWYS